MEETLANIDGIWAYRTFYGYCIHIQFGCTFHNFHSITLPEIDAEYVRELIGRGKFTPGKISYYKGSAIARRAKHNAKFFNKASAEAAIVAIKCASDHPIIFKKLLPFRIIDRIIHKLDRMFLSAWK